MYMCVCSYEFVHMSDIALVGQKDGNNRFLGARVANGCELLDMGAAN